MLSRQINPTWFSNFESGSVTLVNNDGDNPNYISANTELVSLVKIIAKNYDSVNGKKGKQGRYDNDNDNRLQSMD